MNNFYLTKPKTGETPEDEDFLLRQVLNHQGRGVRIHFSKCENPIPETKPGLRGYKFLCDYVLNAGGRILHTEGGDTRREAFEAVLAKVAVVRLEGKKESESFDGPGAFGWE